MDGAKASWNYAHQLARTLKPAGPCESCGSTKKTEVHHVSGDWRDNRIENLERLCSACHKRRHKTKGRCSICGAPQHARNLCNKHYLQERRAA